MNSCCSDSPGSTSAGGIGRYFGTAEAKLTHLDRIWSLATPVYLATFTVLTQSGYVGLAHGRSLVEPHLLGRAITLLNIGAMGGGFLVQFVSGTIINLFPTEAGVYPLEAYRVVFALQALLVGIGFLAYWGTRETHMGR